MPKATIDHLIQVAAHGPTGVNNRGLLFTVLDRAEDMERFRQMVMGQIEQQIKGNHLPQGFDFFKAIFRSWTQGNDILFRGAPHLLLVSSPASGPTPVPDSLIALSYFELYAQSMDIGTLWNGFVYLTLTRILPELQGELGIPADHTMGYAMSFGRPAVRYHRTVQREDVQVNRVRMTTG
ncbi:MAG: nitroreductase family protein [Desulfobulbaceae bacterium]|nr:nitroreductase family protein [Desulfobulbaceae bacterium]